MAAGLALSACSGAPKDPQESSRVSSSPSVTSSTAPSLRAAPADDGPAEVLAAFPEGICQAITVDELAGALGTIEPADVTKKTSEGDLCDFVVSGGAVTIRLRDVYRFGDDLRDVRPGYEQTYGRTETLDLPVPALIVVGRHSGRGPVVAAGAVRRGAYVTDMVLIPSVPGAPETLLHQVGDRLLALVAAQ